MTRHMRERRGQTADVAPVMSTDSPAARRAGMEGVTLRAARDGKTGCFNPAQVSRHSHGNLFVDHAEFGDGAHGLGHLSTQVASSAGRRGARLRCDHDRTAARKNAGRRGSARRSRANRIASLESGDSHRMCVNVAGPAAPAHERAHLAQRTQVVVAGSASRRSTAISRPQVVHVPYSPSFRRCSAASISVSVILVSSRSDAICWRSQAIVWPSGSCSSSVATSLVASTMPSKLLARLAARRMVAVRSSSSRE